MMGRRGFLKAIGAAVLGLSIALKAPEVKQPEPFNEPEASYPMRFDVLYGFASVQPHYVCRIEWA